MIPKANFLQLPTTTIVGLLLILLNLNFVAVAEEPATAAEESEVRGPTFHGLINIDDNQENLQDYMTSSDGSGDEVITDDEDQGSGNEEEDVYPSSGTSVEPELSAVTAAPVLKSKLTPCLSQHKHHKASGKVYVPHCTKKGEYHKLQCTKHACWCVDPNGVLIKGTNRTESDEKPDCEKGANLSPCLKSLLKHSSGLLGSFRPICSHTGEYKSIQCHGSKCWCVNKQGTEVESTKVDLPQLPTCVEMTPISLMPSTTIRRARPTTEEATTTTTEAATTTTEAATTTSSTTTSTATIKLTSTTKRNDFLPPKNPGYDVNVNGLSVTSLNEVTSAEDHNNLSGSEQSQSGDNATPVTREPGIMAAIIAGAVVGLFVSILLAMFVVYRMRKKDEGSYPLDEPSKNNYTYTKAPDKEFYA